jgi:hypothetical protein
MVLASFGLRRKVSQCNIPHIIKLGRYSHGFPDKCFQPVWVASRLTRLSPPPDQALHGYQSPPRGGGGEYKRACVRSPSWVVAGAPPAGANDDYSKYHLTQKCEVRMTMKLYYTRPSLAAQGCYMH